MVVSGLPLEHAKAASIIYYVNASAVGNNNGTSWANAYTDLQSAIASATSGNEIWVAAGTYKPTSSTDRGISFTLKNGVALYGGFAGTETLRTQRNWLEHITILSADIGAQTVANDNSYHVIYGAGINNSAKLDGFTITAGRAEGNIPHANYGGGIFLSTSSPTLENLTIKNNYSIGNGGGIYNINGNPSLTNLVFSGNSTSNQGGGMSNSGGSPKLTNITFSGNIAFGGGGMNNDMGDIILMDVTFSDNKAAYGAGMSNLDNNSLLKNVTFKDNVGGYGGGMYNCNNHGVIHYPTLRNVTFNGNSASNGGGAMYNSATNPVIVNSILWGDGSEVENSRSVPVISDSLIQGGCPAKAACQRIINSNPILGPLSDNGGFTKTVPLGLGSPAIDAGNGNTCTVIDQRGVARPQGPACDIGAYERQQNALILRSQAQNDGWILGVIGNGYVLGSLDAANPFFYVGDSANNYQYRTILSFDTTSLILPAGIPMTIATGVALKVKLQSVVGANPYNSLGNLLIDVRKVSFGDSAALQLNDFNATADADIIGGIPNIPGTPVGGFYTKTWLKNMLPYLNKNGLTQFRLRFATNTNNNLVADDLKFYSGNAANVADRPQLIIYYYVP